MKPVGPLLDGLRFVVEVAVHLPHTVRWLRDGDPERCATAAHRRRDVLAAQGFRARVRPFINK